MKEEVIYMDGVNIMDDTNRWVFPKSISIEEVPDYLNAMKLIDARGSIVFDLTHTTSIHSSFIGFLIHSKHTIEGNGGKLILHLSMTVEKILVMLKINDYFSPDHEFKEKKKSA